MMESELPFHLLPGGTVTFLFTDIEGSTHLLETFRDQYFSLLNTHREILRKVFDKWNGHEVDCRGEEFFIAFPRATDALAAAVDVQRKMAGHDWLGGAKVRVRIGLHTGEPLVTGDSYVGMDVHRAARIGNLGYGGQILLSETTATLVRNELPQGVRMLNMGRHKLKDVQRPEQIYQLVIDGLRNEFPPLKSIELVPSALVRWRASKSKLLRQIIRAGIGGAIPMTTISMISILQISYALPEDFHATTEVVTLPVWISTNFLLGLVWGGFQGMGSGLMTGLADIFWKNGRLGGARLLLAGIAGLIYSTFLIFTAISSESWTNQGAEVFVPVYIAYGLIMGACFCLVIPTLESNVDLRSQIIHSLWSSSIIAVTGVTCLFIAYGGEINNKLFRLDIIIFLLSALFFPLGFALILSQHSKHERGITTDVINL